MSYIFTHSVITSLLCFVIENVSAMHSVTNMFRFHWKCFWTIIITISTLLRGSKIFESLVWWAPIFVALPSIKYVGTLYVVGWSCLLLYCCWLIWPFFVDLILAGIAYGYLLFKSLSLISNQLLGISSLLNGNNLR